MASDSKKAVIEIIRGLNETNSSVLRRFSRRVGSSGILQLLKRRRFKERLKSENVRKKEALRRLERSALLKKLYKQGKIPGPTKSRYFQKSGN